MLKFAIIGAGAGGQSMAAILTDKGYNVRLYDIDREKIHRLQKLDAIKVTGVIQCEAKPAVITDSIEEVMTDVDVVMIVSTTDAHGSIAAQIKPYLKDGQIVMLNPGHCGGALEIAHVLRGENGCGKDLIILDEPTSGLDRYHMEQVGELLRQLASQGKAILVVTHDEELAAGWCDRIVNLGADDSGNNGSHVSNPDASSPSPNASTNFATTSTHERNAQ